MNYLIAVAIGLVAGVSSGLFGVGGGVIIVPLAVAFFGLSQQSGSATSLVALLLPVGALGVWQYYRLGYIGPENLKYGGLIALGILFGTFFGAKLAVQMTSANLAKFFSLYLFFMAIRIWVTAK
jgi:uncharacterized membrane protein YfcA